jgi:cell division transport system permease protein
VSRFYKRRISYLPTFLSISMVLFLAGLIGLLIMNANKMKETIKEDIALSIYFKDSVPEADILKMQKQFEEKPNVIGAKYISKEEGAKLWPMGAEGIKLLGFNPIPNTLDIHFKSEFVVFDSLNTLKTSIENMPGVRDVQFDQDVVDNLDKYVRVTGIVLVSLAVLMCLISIALINSAIRLNMYSRRFLIKSMQLVGATKNFIRRPFILTGIVTGLCSAILAALLLTGSIYYFQNKFGFLIIYNTYLQTAILLGGLLIIGVLISGLSSYFAINKYLKLKLDDLF